MTTIKCNGVNSDGEQTCPNTFTALEGDAAVQARAAGWKVNLFGLGQNYCPSCLGGNRRWAERIAASMGAKLR